MKSIVKYPGSKWSIADWIISFFPEHHSYLEPFFGSGAVFFNKPRSHIETINDLDGNVVNLFECIRKDPEEEQQEELNFSIRLVRWKEDKEKGYKIGYDVPQSVNGLRRLSDFEVYLLRLSRAGVRLLDDEKEDFDEVTAEEMPEPTYE